MEATGKFRRNMPDSIPIAILAYLAIDTRHQKQGLRRALFRDAALRVRFDFLRSSALRVSSWTRFQRSERRKIEARPLLSCMHDRVSEIVKLTGLEGYGMANLQRPDQHEHRHAHRNNYDFD